MPGQRSLDEQRYYAQPRNRFWDLIGEVLAVGSLWDLAYEKRLEILVDHKIALWDVINTCRRKGSLDADISDVVVNDLTGFMNEHPSVQAIFCNGRKSEQLFERYAVPLLGDRAAQLELRYLPSSSPAHASMTKQVKAEKWCVIRKWMVRK
jgi:hypoxanthine-DNA glycosylase